MRTREISDGQKPWASSSSHEQLHVSTQPIEKITSRSTETTKVSLRAGNEDAAETLALTRYSNVLQHSYEQLALPSTRDMSGAPETPLMTHLEAYIPRLPSSSPPSSFQTNSRDSLSTTTILQMIIASRMANLTHQHEFHPNQNQSQKEEPNASGETKPSAPWPDNSMRLRPDRNGSNFGRNQFRQRTQTANPNATRHFPPNLTPVPSTLRPICSAKDRLLMWKPMTVPPTEGSNPSPLSTADEARIQEVLAEAYSDSTKGTYGTGLLVFHVYCDKKGIEEAQRTPCGQTLLSGFISTLIGDYSAQAIENYTYGLRAWHIIHRIPWKINPAELQTLFASAAKNQPPKSEKAQKPPCTIDDLEAIRENLDLKTPFDAAVFACLTTTFWAVARLGEFTIPRLDAFDPTVHVKRSDLNLNVSDRHGNRVVTIFIPWTKASKSRGEELNWAAQPHTRADPAEAMQNHLKLNKFDANTHLFQHQWKGTSRPMSKAIFLTRIRKALADAKRGNLTGHSFRIGGTLEYLLRGIDFPVVRVKGRWASETAFTGYLRKHGQILAPYMQANPELQNRFIRLAMPPVR